MSEIRDEALRLLREHIHALREFHKASLAGHGPSSDEVSATQEAILRPLVKGLTIEEQQNEKK